MSALTDEQREAELMKKKGNEQFVEKNLNLALDFYQKAVELGESKASYIYLGHVAVTEFSLLAADTLIIFH